MKHLTFIKAVIVGLTIAFTFLAVGCNKEKIAEPLAAHFIHQSEKLFIPAAIDLPANGPLGNSRVATYFASGVQKYKAQIKPGTESEYIWVLVAPNALLYNSSNKEVGTHGAGPFWSLYGGMDSIFGQHFTPARTAPSPEPGNIDWLLLMPKAGTTPTGIFQNVSYIQRIATKGGKAPSTAPSGPSSTVDIPYEAVYRFSKKN